MGEFKIRENMEPITAAVPAGTTLAHAQQLANQVTGVFVVVGESNQPNALLRDEYLSLLTGDQNRTLGELLDRFPALVAVDVDVEKLTNKDLTDFSQLLAVTTAPGVVVLENDEAIGILTRGTIARALPLSALIEVAGANVRTVLVFDSCMFICRQCPEPRPKRRPRQCDVAPLCYKDRTHGPMEPMNP